MNGQAERARDDAGVLEAMWATAGLTARVRFSAHVHGPADPLDEGAGVGVADIPRRLLRLWVPVSDGARRFADNVAQLRSRAGLGKNGSSADVQGLELIYAPEEPVRTNFEGELHPWPAPFRGHGLEATAHPLWMFDEVQNLAGFHEAGVDEVAGVSCTQFDGVWNTAAAVEPRAGPVRVAVWIASDGLVRRLSWQLREGISEERTRRMMAATPGWAKMVLATSKVDASQDGWETLELSDFGVGIDPP